MKNAIKSLFLLFVCTLFTFSLTAQENKNIGITNFSSVSVANGIDLYLTQSTSENIKLTGDPDLIKNVIVTKEGSTLKIRHANNGGLGKIFKGKTVKIYVNYKSLEGIDASGGSDVFTQNTLKTEKLSINSSGGSDLKLQVVTKDIQIRVSGGSDLDLKGSASNMELNSSGGSDVKATDFVVDYAKVNVSGGSDADIHVTKGLEASATGGSDISYKGNAALKKTSSSKSGDIKKID
jgi:hypothetical protein